MEPLIPHSVNWTDLDDFFVEMEDQGKDVIHIVPAIMRQGSSNGPCLMVTEYNVYVRRSQ